ncbi:hypothetical protein [Marinobacter nauticus]|uniref:Transcriptional regulator n=1 Tax=Marinobacter nauticus TaxID=2743 RepID=A0A833JQI3_MARNT|nr:hypothetical protein [Marinobacter nauticus]KAE8546162.1 hypothetical protein F6453_1408 [Marinobacter nauticus]
MSENRVTAAFEAAREKFDSFATVCGILDISNAYAYHVMKEGEMSLPCALKMEIILEGDITWRELCPRQAAKIDVVKERMTIAL